MDNAIGLGIILSLQDRASQGLDAVRNRLTVLRDVSQDMMKKFDAGAKQLVAGIASMAAGAKAFSVMNSMFGSSVTTAADFEQAMARVGAVSGATGEDFERLSKQARDLGRDTQFSATQAAASQENLARAGFKTNEIINAMPGLLNMAAAEGMDLANAADIASSAIRGFGLDASEANRVADVLAKTSSASNTSIALLGESLKYVAPLAKGLGVSIEQTNAMLGVMANAGIKGSQAGTSLKSAFQRLSEEPKRVSKALAELGVKAKTSEGDLRPLPELMKDLSAKMEGMGKGDKIGMLSKIFGGVASSGMLAIMDSVANGSLPELEAALYGASGAAKEMADRMNATAQGAMLRLESASEGLRIVIGNHLIPVYTWVIDKMAQFKSWLTQLIEAHPVISKAVIGFTTALLGLSGVTLILVGALASIGGFIKMWPLLKVMAVSALSNIRTQARMAVSSLSGLSVPVVGMIALAGALYYAWRKNLWGIREMVTAVSEGFKMALSASTDGIAEVDEELANKLKAAGIWDYAVMMGKVFFRVRQFWNGLVEGFREGVKFIKSAFDVIADIFSPVIESGQELLKFLGILKPVTETQSNTWKEWGRFLGRIAPIVLGVIAAFKGFSVISGIFGTLGKAILGMFSLISAHPVVAIITAIVAAGIYLYTHWDEISEYVAASWEYLKGKFAEGIAWIAGKLLAFSDRVEGIVRGVVDWVKQKWQSFLDWWDSWHISDKFAPVINWASRVKERASQIWQDFSDWWDSWTLSDVFAVLGGYADKALAFIYAPFTSMLEWFGNLELPDFFKPLQQFALDTVEWLKTPFTNFASWISSLFSKLNPFNWELPSWLGGGKAGAQQVKNAEAALNSWGASPIDAYATGGIITQPKIALIGEAGREAIIPLEDRSNGIPLLMSAISEMGVTSSDILPYLNPVAPEIESPTVNVSAPVQSAPANVTVSPIVPPVVPAANVNVAPVVQPSDVSVLPAPMNIQPADVSVSPADIDVSGIESVLEAIREQLANKVPYAPPAVNVIQPEALDGNLLKDMKPDFRNYPQQVISAPAVDVAPVVQSPAVNVAPIVQPAPAVDVSTAVNTPAVNVDPIIQPSLVQQTPFDKVPVPIVNVLPANLPEIRTPDIMQAPLDLSELNNSIIRASQRLADMMPDMMNKDADIELIAPQNNAPSTPLLIQHSQNQAVMTGQAQAKAQSQAPDRPVNVNNHVDVTIEGKPVELYIDGERVGAAVLRWTERQSTRNGVSPF